MSAKQIYATVNKIAKNISYTGSDVIDITTFTAFGQAALSDTLLTESVYNELYDLIGRTVIAIDEAEDDERNIVVDAFEYGSILQKFSFALQDSQKASEWDIEHPENPYEVANKSGIKVAYFEQYIPAFSWEDVSYTTQLKEAFRGPESLAGFTDALYTRMRNAYRIAKNGLSDAAIGGIMAKVYADATDLVTPSANAARQVRHLLTEYNTTMGTSLTDTTSRNNTNYLEYVRKQIIKDKENLNKMTKLYNDGSVERRTMDSNYRLDMSLDFAASYDKFWADSYNTQYVQLPNHNTIVNWGIATAPETVKVSIDGEATTTIAKIIGFAYDKDAVVATMDRSRFVSIYDQWNDRNVFKLTAERRYIADTSENCIIYLND